MVTRLLSSRPLLGSLRGYSTRPIRPLLGRYADQVPVELARVQSGRKVRLRDYDSQMKLGRYSFDLKLKDGLVLPYEGDDFVDPNGCSLREPTSPMFQEVVRNFRGRNILISILPQGTPLPPSLTILHEHSDHYSIQCTRPITLNALNKELTEFFDAHARIMEKEEFHSEYPFS